MSELPWGDLPSSVDPSITNYEWRKLRTSYERRGEWARLVRVVDGQERHLPIPPAALEALRKVYG